MKSRSYLAYGIGIQSDVDLSPYLHEGATDRLSLILYEGDGGGGEREFGYETPRFETHGRKIFFASDKTLMSYREGQTISLVVENVACFIWTAGQQDISFNLLDCGDSKLLSFWAINYLLPIYLVLECEYQFLHSSAISFENSAVLFSAPSYGGKSTLAEHFLSKGHALISDDRVATYRCNGKYLAIPSIDRFRPYRKFEDLGLVAPHFCLAEQPMQVIYHLSRDKKLKSTVIKPIQGFKKFEELFPNYLYNFPHLKTGRLKFLAGLLNEVPTFDMRIPDDLDRLDEVYGSICSHISTLLEGLKKARN